MVVAILTGVGLFWLELWQLWSEARPSRFVLHTSEGVAYIPAQTDAPEAAAREVIVITERQAPPAS
jgi:hypothetical protein